MRRGRELTFAPAQFAELHAINSEEVSLSSAHHMDGHKLITGG